MARVTVEDCIEQVTNRFELVMLAVQRSRDITAGARPSIPRDGDKNPVIALREIAESSIEQEPLWEELTNYFRTSEAAAAAADSTPEALLSASPGGGSKNAPAEADAKADKKDSDSDSSDDATDETEGEQWSEEDMLRALQEMQGEPSP